MGGRSSSSSSSASANYSSATDNRQVLGEGSIGATAGGIIGITDARAITDSRDQSWHDSRDQSTNMNVLDNSNRSSTITDSRDQSWNDSRNLSTNLDVVDNSNRSSFWSDSSNRSTNYSDSSDRSSYFSDSRDLSTFFSANVDDRSDRSVRNSTTMLDPGALKSMEAALLGNKAVTESALNFSLASQGNSLAAVRDSSDRALGFASSANATLGAGFAKLLEVGKSMFDTNVAAVDRAGAMTQAAYRDATAEKSGTLDNKTILILGVAAAAALAFMARK